MKAMKLLLLLVLVFPTFAEGPTAASVEESSLIYVASEKFIRTELYFGLTKPDKTTLTDAEWSAFVDEAITPRFPNGFTVLDAEGQWRNNEGKIAKESSKVFIVVYSRKEREAAG